MHALYAVNQRKMLGMSQHALTHEHNNNSRNLSQRFAKDYQNCRQNLTLPTSSAHACRHGSKG
jgi:hypothetical protein